MKRQMMIVAIFCASAQPIVNIAASGRLTRYTIERPSVSLKGAARTGPKESPRQYIEIPSNETVVETPNHSDTSFVPEEYIEDMKVLIERAELLIEMHSGRGYVHTS